MSCCLSCASTGGFCTSGLGAFLPGHAIPYHLNTSEIQTFLAQHASDAALSSYLWLKQPPWGIILHEAYGSLLVWFDASGVLHVVDVTNMEVVRQVEQAPFESPDSGFFENIQHSFNDLFQAVQGVSVVVGLAALGYVLWATAKR